MQRARLSGVVFGFHMLETLVFEVKQEETYGASEANNQQAGLRAVMTSCIRGGQLKQQSNTTGSIQMLKDFKLN